jgi:hypothetical protein
VSLRDLPPDQSAPSRRTLWGRLHYVPLVFLVVCVVIATVGGIYIRERNDRLIAAAAAEQSAPASLTATGGRAATLPASCAPAVEPPAHEMWLGGHSEEAEAVWAANTADLANSPIVVGQHDWVFWNDVQAQNFSQAVGRRLLSSTEAASWYTYLDGLRDDLEAQGIPFFVAMTPAKWGVYPQELPAWVDDIRGSGPLDQLIARYPDLPIIDLRQPLREQSADVNVFSKVNSHWTDYGAYEGWNFIAQCIEDTDPALGDFTPVAVDGVTIGPDHNEFAPYGVENDTPDWTVPEYSEALHPVTVTLADGTTSVTDGSQPTGLMTLPAATETDGAQSPSSALVLRDSFGDSMSMPLQQAFTKTWQVRHNLDAAATERPDVAALVAEHHPDVVILQLAQRHLNFPPTPSS